MHQKIPQILIEKMKVKNLEVNNYGYINPKWCLCKYFSSQKLDKFNRLWLILGNTKYFLQ